MWRDQVLVFLTCFCCVWIIKGQFFDCHDDPGYSPDEGTLDELQFTWLGALQYIHVKNGTPHYFRVPRVILISRQFVLSTALDAAQIPVGYALGNVIFGDYERDEGECHVTMEDMAAGMECEPAILLMPIADVLLHPEYKHFGAKYSLALMKLITPVKSKCEPTILLMPIADVLLHPEYKHFGAKYSLALMKLITPVKSKYMLPACLPFKNYLLDDNGRLTRSKLFHIDFTSDVPRDFIEEEKAVERVSILPRELCFLYDGAESIENATKMTQNRMACTTGCGFRSGAPTLVHEHTGHWSIVALSQGGHFCPDPLRSRRPPAPPQHIMIHPYVPWITAAITGKAVGAFAKDDPFGFIMPRASIYDLIAHGWIGHWWMGGLRCYDRGEAADDMFKFYHEVFQLKPITETFLTYYLEIDSAHDSMIICVKVGLPFRLGQPRVWELDTPIVKVRIPMIRFYYMYRFQIEAWAYNASELDSSSEESSSSESMSDDYEMLREGRAGKGGEQMGRARKGGEQTPLLPEP